MKTIKVGFSRSKNFNIADYVIRKNQKTEFSHTYILLANSQVFEANGQGVILSNYDHWKKTHVVIFEFELEISEERYQELINFVNKHLGTSYGYLQLLWIFLGIDSWFDNGSKYFICSELTLVALKDKLGVPHGRHDGITPKDVLVLVKQHVAHDETCKITVN